MPADGITLSVRERDILRSVLSRFADRIDRVSVFGSRALGTARPASDIDLVLYGPIQDADVARLWTMFADSSLAVTVDIVRYDTLGDSSLRRHIDRCARSLFRGKELTAPS